MVEQYDVQIVDVVKNFGEIRAVDHVSLNVSPGQFLTLLGPSGCGKTTTLRMIGGFEHPDAGSIFIQGKNVVNTSPAERDTSMVFQDYALFPHMTVAENIAFGLQMRGLNRQEIKARTEAALKLVNLPDLGKRKPNQMSGGQKQRVALARSLVLRPAVLLLDEPLGALDAQIRKQMQLELKNIQKQLGQTFIYVTHDQEESLTMSDQIAIMRNGKIEQLGTPEEVYENPATPFVASFLGDCNLLNGKFVAAGAGICIFRHSALGDLHGRINDKQPLASNSTAVFCLRPENISLKTCADANLDLGKGTSIKGVVTGRVYRGVVTRYIVNVGGEEITAETLGQGTITPGESVMLTWEPRNAIILPADKPVAAVREGSQ
jgi:spermidine/putrescine transport system ATP-binding protein